MLVIIARYTDPIEAQIASGRLGAEGIDVHVGDQGIALANWEWRLATGGVKLRVPRIQSAHALRILADLESGAFALEEDGAPSQTVDRETPSSRAAWVSLMLLGLPLPWRRRKAAPATSDTPARQGS